MSESVSKHIKETFTNERIAELLREECREPLQWWYLSFADAHGSNGNVLVEARGFTSAIAMCSILKINPGGEAMGVPIPPDKTPDPKYAYKLLSPRDVSECFNEEVKTIGEWEAEYSDGKAG